MQYYLKQKSMHWHCAFKLSYFTICLTKEYKFTNVRVQYDRNSKKQYMKTNAKKFSN